MRLDHDSKRGDEWPNLSELGEDVARRRWMYYARLVADVAIVVAISAYLYFYFR